MSIIRDSYVWLHEIPSLCLRSSTTRGFLTVGTMRCPSDFEAAVHDRIRGVHVVHTLRDKHTVMISSKDELPAIVLWDRAALSPRPSQQVSATSARTVIRGARKTINLIVGVLPGMFSRTFAAARVYGGDDASAAFSAVLRACKTRCPARSRRSGRQAGRSGGSPPGGGGASASTSLLPATPRMRGQGHHHPCAIGAAPGRVVH
jgi:hypothetical protein